MLELLSYLVIPGVFILSFVLINMRIKSLIQDKKEKEGTVEYGRRKRKKLKKDKYRDQLAENVKKINEARMADRLKYSDSKWIVEKNKRDREKDAEEAKKLHSIQSDFSDPNQASYQNPFYLKNFQSFDSAYEAANMYFPGLSDSSIKQLATAIFTELTVSESEKASYNGLCMNFCGLLEKEMKRIILTQDPAIGEKELTWGKIVDFMKEKDISREFKPNFRWKQWAQDMEKVNRVRNKAAHGQPITKDEYKLVKETALSTGFLWWISSYNNAILNKKRYS